MRFGDCQLDRDRYELRRLGELVPVQPLVMEVLVYLIDHRDRVVTRDELIDQVWEGRAVSDSALTRCIKEARKAIGDEGSQQAWIKTVHGRGYRFVGDLEATTESRMSVAMAPASNSGAPAEPGREARLESTYVAPASRTPAPVRVVRRVAAGALLLALLLLVWGWFRPDMEPEPEREDPVRLALVPVAGGDEEGELGLLALSIDDQLRQRLSELEQLVVLTAEPGEPWGKASELGASHLLAGELTRAEGARKAQLALNLVSLREVAGDSSDPAADTPDSMDGVIPGKPVPLGRFDLPFLVEPGDVERLVLVRDQMISRLLSELLPALDVSAVDKRRGDVDAVAPPGADAARSATAPSNVDAYRLYLTSQERLRQVTCAGDSILQLLDRSLALDAGFAPAWEAYGWAQYNLVSSCARGGEFYRAALNAADQALAISPDRPQAVALKASVLVETGRIEDAYALLLASLERRPESSAVEYQMAYVLRYAGFLELAQDWLEKTLAREPNYLTVDGWTPNVVLYQGDPDRFLDLVPETGTPIFRYYRALAHLVAARPDQAASAARPAYAENPEDSFARLSEALVAAVDGRPEDARVILGGLALQREKLGASDGELTYKIAQLAAYHGDLEEAARLAGLAVDQGFFSASYLRSDPLMAAVRATAGWRNAIERAQRAHEQFADRFGLEPVPVQ